MYVCNCIIKNILSCIEMIWNKDHEKISCHAIFFKPLGAGLFVVLNVNRHSSEIKGLILDEMVYNILRNLPYFFGIR